MPQPSEGITYAQKIDKAEAPIDWHEDAVQVWRRIRAFNPWPIAETRFNGAQLRIWEAEVREPGTRRGRRGRCLPPRLRASTSPAAAVCCEFFACSSPAARPLLAQEFIKAQRLEGVRFAPV